MQRLRIEAAARLRAAGIEFPEGEAEQLLLAALGRERAWLYAHPEAEPTAGQRARFAAWVARRAAHEPPQYITGAAEFHGRMFHVAPAVLIPRPETELLVEAALRLIPAGGAVGAPTRVVDAGTGSGCLAVTLALERPAARVLAVDRSRAALAIGRANARRFGARVEFAQTDWLAALAPGWDVIVSNPPYVRADEWPDLAPEVRDHEPRAALVPGPAGLEAYARLIPEAEERLRPGGHLLLELGHDSAPGVRARLAGWREVATLRDLQGRERVLSARR